jgi:hypothetical protein
VTTGRERDPEGRPRNARPRDRLGRPLPRGAEGFAPYDEPALPADEALAQAQRLIDDGRPFTAHEVLEAVWKATTGPERELWRALAQLAVAITHGLRGNDAGAATLRERAAEHLEPYAGTRPHGIDVDALIGWAQRPTGPPPRLLGGDGSGDGSGGGGSVGGALRE